jgi:hypothetical protein
MIASGIDDCSFAQVRESQKWPIEIGPFGSLPSPVFQLMARQGLRLRLFSAGLSLDAFVYDADSKELVGKSDDRVLPPGFTCEASVPLVRRSLDALLLLYLRAVTVISICASGAPSFAICTVVREGGGVLK